MLAELVRHRFEIELRKFEYWAAMPMVVSMAKGNNSAELMTAFKDYFSAVVAREPYSSLYLINRKGECIACDDHRRLSHPYCRNVVSKKPDALTGFAGKANIGCSVMSVNCRPVVPLTVPVWNEGSVIAILRAGIDMGRLSRELIASLSIEREVRLYIFDPSLTATIPKELRLQSPIDLPPYVPPSDALRAAFSKASGSVFLCRDQREEYIVALERMQKPQWVFLVSQPMSEVPAMIRKLFRENCGNSDPRSDEHAAVVAAFKQYAIGAFEVNALDYLLKPVTRERFHQILSLPGLPFTSPCSKRLGMDDVISIQSGRQRIRLPLKKVSLIQAEGDFTILRLNDGVCGTIWRGLSEWENLLPRGRFVRIHRGLIVNLDHVESFETMPGSRLLLRLMGVGEPCHASRRLTPLLRQSLQARPLSLQL